MCRVITTLDRAMKEGYCHALLESPTGTGKSLSLLCSTLAWQQNYKLKNQYNNLSHSKPNPEAITDPLNYGGGFVPETTQTTQITSVQPSGNSEAVQSASNSKNQKKKVVPTIYYSSRTHTQISQVVREYKKTSYRVPMSVLASRKHYCTNGYVRGKDNIDEECKLLLRNPDVGCTEFKNMHKVKGHPSLQKGGCHEAFDIEDLVKVGQVVKGCPYYAARHMADDAQLVFCPYSYIVNPVIRGAMDVDIKGAIVILDEAHNIEDIARDAGSVDLEEDVLLKLQTELEQLCMVDTAVYGPLCEMTQDLISWIEQRKSTLEKREFQHYVSCWTGDKALRELQEANISQQCFPILLECATKAIKAASDAESEGPHLSGASVITLEGLFSSLTYFFSRNGCHMVDYQLVLQRCVKKDTQPTLQHYVKRDARNAFGGWTYTLSLWCLNPTVVFKDIAELSLSVILTSGTLSPMSSFSSELGVQFGTCLEASHVIDAESQVWAAIIPTGPGNYPLNASYKTADGYAFQDALGKSLEEICNIVPGGALVFFPSYKLMEKLCTRWSETGQWSRLNARKSLFIEPRGGSLEEFESVLRGYYDSVSGSKKPALGKKKRFKKTDPDHKPPENIKTEGAAFLAVCRGKVSEGIDFSDDKARVVIVVGIPFPNLHDIQVSLKKKYNDAYKLSKNLTSGSEWYCQQAFRALNQAIGRCIRHRFDYGAVILIDERYREERNRAYISKWLRKSFRQFESFDMSLEGLKSFFRDVKDQVPKSITQVSDPRDKNIPSLDQSNEFTKREDNKLNMSNHAEQEVISVVDYEATFPQPLGGVNVETSVQPDKDMNSCKEFVGLDCSYKKDSRYPGSLSMTFSNEYPETSIVKETPDERPIIEACPQTKSMEREFTRNTCINLESSYNLSVNSHTRKRRKSMCSPLVDLTREDFGASDSQTLCCTSFTRISMASADANRRIDFDLETDCEGHGSKPVVPHITGSVGDSISSDSVMNKRLQISCSLCGNPLGLPENHLYVWCSLTSSSKTHILSLWDRKSEPHATNAATIPVLMTDISSVDQRFCNKSLQNSAGQGIWCKEDGCVYDNIFCPFCTSSNNCLGVQIMATDASNVQLLNKILFNCDLLEIKNLEASKELASNDKDSLPANCLSVDKSAVMSYIDKFSYSPKEQTGAWQTTRSKTRLPKRDLNSRGDS